MNIPDDFDKLTRKYYNFNALNMSPDLDESAMLKLISPLESVAVPYMQVKRAIRCNSQEFRELLELMVVDSIVLNGKTICTFSANDNVPAFRTSCFKDPDGLRRLFDDVLQHKAHT